MPLTPQELYDFQQLSTAGKDAEIAALRKELGCKEMEIKMLKEQIQGMTHLKMMNAGLMDRQEGKMEGMRSIVKELVDYAEGFTHKQNEKADTIKNALLSLSFNKRIPESVMDDGLKERVNNLGKKERGIEVKTDAMFKISGNDNVNIGC